MFWISDDKYFGGQTSRRTKFFGVQNFRQPAEILAALFAKISAGLVFQQNLLDEYEGRATGVRNFLEELFR